MVELDQYPHDFLDSLHIGISRCNTLDMLNRYYLRWVDEIGETGRMEEVVGWFRERKEELIGFGLRSIR